MVGKSQHKMDGNLVNKLICVTTIEIYILERNILIENKVLYFNTRRK